MGKKIQTCLPDLLGEVFEEVVKARGATESATAAMMIEFYMEEKDMIDDRLKEALAEVRREEKDSPDNDISVE